MFDVLHQAFSVYEPLDIVLSAVDFVLVYLLIYQVLVLIRGTKAVGVLVGLLLLIVFFFVSKDEYLGLSTLHWLLDKFIGSFILVVVVLFQADIRRALATFARSSVFRTMTAQQGAQLVEELVRASTALSRARIGALIAIERDGDLAQYADEGVKLDAMVSNEALFAIFNPSNANPLHDGATIIRSGRVAAAGCFLPLTANPRVDKALGTRHRAAIGLTEDTDAAVLIVSEETGVISVALGGKLTRNLDANSLRQLLHALVGSAQAKPAPRVRPAAPAPEGS
ncbi:MAG: TIGR00159 family protein [Myxococcales bacterium]|nr:TIGR00159 family protein [Myxococcales bacterium]MCB9531273.1 TIGR00159 family protein [Myxococcales bacterium]